MNFWRLATKIFAVFSLFFVNQISVAAQAAQVSNAYELRAGTRIGLRMDNEINSRVGGANDTFTATVAEPVIIRGVLALPVGAVIEGKILKVESASPGGKNGTLSMSFDTIRFASGNKRQIEAVLVKTLHAESSAKPKFIIIAVAATIGGIIGAVSKSDNGALIGAGIGAGAGGGLALLQKGKNVAIKADEYFEIELVKSVSLPARDF